jgi:hypothetical protein
VLAVAAAGVGVVLPPADAAADPAPVSPPPGTVTYEPPVRAAVLDPFRAPPTPYGPGNRGVEYDTWPGQPVVAAAQGTVVFAGAVAGALHVTIAHADGVRTSYSFLATVAVVKGQSVEQGTVVGTAGDTFHFGARIGDVYVDPAALFGEGPTEVILVPHDRPMPPARGGSPDADAMRLLPGPVADVLAWLSEWRARRRWCTPSSDPVPAPAGGRRIAVLVGGLGSSSGQAAITALDTEALGYAPGDVLRFSYRGGRVRGSGRALGGIPSHDYEAADTLGDLRAAGRRLADAIRDVSEAAPGATIDVIGHSQGGIVSRLAVDELADEGAVRAGLGVVVTIGSSHQGADLASLVRLARSVPGGGAALEVVQDAIGTPIEPDATAVAQLSEGSHLMDELAARPVPDGVDLWSIGARGDVVVASPRTRVPGATNVTVTVDGVFGDHERLPGSPAVTREIGLALSGRRPTCEGRLEALADALSGATLSWVESGLGAVP